MINLTYHNGLMVPGRNHIKPLSLQEAVSGVRELSMLTLLEATGETSGWADRVQKIFKTLINKILGFFKGWFDRVQTFKHLKTEEIIRNKGIILTSSADKTISLPVYLLNPKIVVDSKALHGELVKVNAQIESAVAGNVKMSAHMPQEVITSSEIAQDIFTSLLGGNSSHGQETRIIQSLMYGEKQETSLATMDKRKLIDAFLNLDNEFSSILDIRDGLNVIYTKFMASNELENSLNIQGRERIMKYIVNINLAIITVCNTFLTIAASAYNTMYEVMSYMIQMARKGGVQRNVN